MPMPYSLDFYKFIARFDTNEMQVLQLCPFLFGFLFWPPSSLHFYVHFSVNFSICCYCSVTKLCLALYDFKDYSTAGSPVLHYLPEFAQIHVHWIGDAIKSSHSLLSPSPPAFSLSQWVGSLHQVAEVLELQLQQ